MCGAFEQFIVQVYVFIHRINKLPVGDKRWKNRVFKLYFWQAFIFPGSICKELKGWLDQVTSCFRRYLWVVLAKVKREWQLIIVLSYSHQWALSLMPELCFLLNTYIVMQGRSRLWSWEVYLLLFILHFLFPFCDWKGLSFLYGGAFGCFWPRITLSTNKEIVAAVSFLSKPHVWSTMLILTAGFIATVLVFKLKWQCFV